MLTVRAQPGMRRVLEAFGGAVDAERQGGSVAALLDWREALIRSQHKVIDFYREVLATDEMPQAERASIEDRIARLETELARLQGTTTSPGRQTSAPQRAA